MLSVGYCSVSVILNVRVYQEMRPPGFGPGLPPWQGGVLPD